MPVYKSDYIDHNLFQQIIFYEKEDGNDNAEGRLFISILRDDWGDAQRNTLRKKTLWIIDKKYYMNIRKIQKMNR